MTEHHCVLCARRGRTRALDEGHVCQPCRNALHVDLGQILDLAAIAGTMPDPFAARSSGTSSRPHPGSRPPLEVARIDPELISIRLEPGDPSSVVPLLAVLESWERAVREDRGFAPYGVASALRGALSTRATLAGVIAFLRSQVDWMCTEPDFAIEQLVDQVRRAVAALRALDPTRERRDGWGIPCPADVDDDACGRRLTIERHDDGRLDLHTDIACRDCGTVWTAQRLLLVALADERVTVWGYPEAITAALGIPRTTLQRWAEHGRVRRWGSRYDAGAAFRLRHTREGHA